MQDQIFRTQFFVTTFVNRFPPGENTTTADSRPPAWTSSTRASSSAWFAHARSIELAQTIATAVQCRWPWHVPASRSATPGSRVVHPAWAPGCTPWSPGLAAA